MHIKLIIPFLVFAICASLATSAQNVNSNIPVKQIDSVYYTCSMHPEIKAVGPGECPKCGMQLIQKSYSDGGSNHQMKMDCGMMHGMDMNEMGNGNSSMMNKPEVVIDTTQHNSVIYTCSMHPEIQSAIPGKCPKCGMELIIKPASNDGKKAKPEKMKMGCGMMPGM